MTPHSFFGTSRSIFDLGKEPPLFGRNTSGHLVMTRRTREFSLDMILNENAAVSRPFHGLHQFPGHLIDLGS